MYEHNDGYRRRHRTVKNPSKKFIRFLPVNAAAGWSGCEASPKDRGLPSRGRPVDRRFRPKQKKSKKPYFLLNIDFFKVVLLILIVIK